MTSPILSSNKFKYLPQCLGGIESRFADPPGLPDTPLFPSGYQQACQCGNGYNKRRPLFRPIIVCLYAARWKQLRWPMWSDRPKFALLPNTVDITTCSAICYTVVCSTNTTTATTTAAATAVSAIRKGHCHSTSDSKFDAWLSKTR